MTIEHWPHSTDSPPFITFESRERRTVASYKRRLKALRRTKIRLQEALARTIRRCWSLVSGRKGRTSISTMPNDALFVDMSSDAPFNAIENGITLAHAIVDTGGLGTSLVQSLAKQLDAQVAIASDAHGTAVSITHATFKSKPRKQPRCRSVTR